MLFVIFCKILQVAEWVVGGVGHDVNKIFGEVNVESKFVVRCHLIVLTKGIDDREDAFCTGPRAPQVNGINRSG